jgi:hypothetical protein
MTISTVRSHLGGVGSVTTLGATITEWCADALPALQIVSTLIAIIAGGLTIIWYIRQLRDKK